MVFVHHLIRDYESFESDTRLILLPKRYLLTKLFGLNFWFLAGGLFSYKLFWAAAPFAWVYGGACAVELSRIWSLHRLSLVRYWLCVAVFVLLCILVGWLTRILLIRLWL